MTVLDVNDNGPVFSQSSYTHSVNEVNVSASNGLSLTTISAMDNDGTYPNNYVTFNITAGNDDNVFEINTTTVCLLNIIPIICVFVLGGN